MGVSSAIKGASSLASSLGGKGSSAQGGVDYAAIQQAVGQSQQNIANRYAQLGIGTPSGSAASAAAGGTSLASSGPSTMEQMDEQFAGEQGQALAGQLESQFPGGQSFGGDLGSLASSAGFGSGDTSSSASNPDAFGTQVS